MPDLREQVRSEVVAAGTLVVRGGPDSAAKIVSHVQRMARAFVLDGEPVLGISVFAVLDDVGPCSLTGILQRMSTYRIVHLVSVEHLVNAGFGVLPTFGRPHFTLLLGALDQVETLVSILGAGEPNPRYGDMTRRTRRRPQ